MCKTIYNIFLNYYSAYSLIYHFFDFEYTTAIIFYTIAFNINVLRTDGNKKPLRSQVMPTLRNQSSLNVHQIFESVLRWSVRFSGLKMHQLEFFQKDKSTWSNKKQVLG